MGKIKAQKSISDKPDKKRLQPGFKRAYFKRKKQDFRLGSASEGQGFTLSRKLKTFRKYSGIKKKKHGNALGTDDGMPEESLDDDKFRQKKFNKLEHLHKKYQEQKAEAARKKMEKEHEMKLHEKSVNIKIQKRKKTNKELSRRTRKGQLIMANQMNHLLEKIKSSS